MAPFTIVVDCADPDRLAHFWAAALGYTIEPPPAGHASWAAYWRSRGLPESELPAGDDAVIDPAGRGPRIWFQLVDERKTGKNRLHLDLNVSGGPDVPLEERRRRIEGEAERLVRLGAVRLRGMDELESIGHYAVAMQDPEGNEFDIN